MWAQVSHLLIQCKILWVFRIFNVTWPHRANQKYEFMPEQIISLSFLFEFYAEAKAAVADWPRRDTTLFGWPFFFDFSHPMQMIFRQYAQYSHSLIFTIDWPAIGYTHLQFPKAKQTEKKKCHLNRWNDTRITAAVAYKSRTLYWIADIYALFSFTHIPHIVFGVCFFYFLFFFFFQFTVEM